LAIILVGWLMFLHFPLIPLLRFFIG